MTYYNVFTNREHATLPASYPDVLGSPDWPLHYSRGWREVQPFTVPEGYAAVPGTRRIEVSNDVPCEVWDIETVEAAQARVAEAEAARLAGLVEEWGNKVRVFQSLLQGIGLSIPTTEDAVDAKVSALVAAGQVQVGSLVALLREQYRKLEPVAADVRAIWDAIKEVTP